MKPFDTDKMPWLFTPHGDGELNEYLVLSISLDTFYSNKNYAARKI